eukprot:gene31465-40865_t
MESNMRVLGSGALREEYEDRMRRERERFELEHREQLLLDQKIASDLEAENLDRLRLLQDLEQKDLLVARRIAEESQQSSSGTPVHHLEDDVEDMDEAEDEKGGRGEDLSRILRSPSGKEKENKKKSGSFVDLTVSSSDKSDAEADDSAPIPLPLQDRYRPSSSSSSSSSSSGTRSGVASSGTKRRRPTKKAAGTSRHPSSLRRFFVPPPPTPAASVWSSPSASASAVPSQPLSPLNLVEQGRPQAEVEVGVEGAWQCGRCTFRNSALLTCCEMCDLDRGDLT